MKYLAFILFAGLATPLMALGATSSARVRGWLLSALVVSTALGDLANVNFVSMELYRGPERGFELGLTDLIALALVAAQVFRFPRRLKWVPANTIPMALFFSIAAISTGQSSEPLLGAFTLFKALRFYLVYWCVVNAVRTGTSLRSIRHGLLALGALATILVLKQKYLDGVYRVPMLFDHSNTVPLYLNLVIPILLLWGLCDKRLGVGESSIHVLAALGMAFCVIMTYSRAGSALTVVAVVGCLVLAFSRAPGWKVGLTAGVVLLLGAAGSAMVADSLLARIRQAPASSGEARDEFNIAAQRMASDRIFGVGVNNFSAALTRDRKYRDHLTVMANEEQGGVAHHIYWLTAAEVGYLGLATFLLVLARFLWIALRWGWSRSSPEGLALTGCAIGFATVNLSGLFEWALRITPVTYQFAVVAGLTVACAEIARQQRRPNSTTSYVSAAHDPEGLVA